MKRMWTYLGILTLLAITALSGCSTKGDAGKTATPNPSEQEAAAIKVNIEEVNEGVLSDTNKLVGEISANTSISILPKLSGALIDLYIKKGDSVKKNQVIGRLDPTDYTLNVQQAEAALEVANAQLVQAKSGTDVNVVGSSYEIAKRGYELEQAAYDRMKALVDAHAASKSQLEQEESQLVQAKSLLTQAAKGDAQSDAGIGVAEAGVKQAQVGVDKARSALKDTEIKATTDGVISDVKVDVGETVGMQTTIANLINVSPAIVKLNVSENNLPKFMKDTELEVSIPSLGKMAVGKVSFVGLEAAPQTKLFPIELEVENPELQLLPGMKVDVTVKNLESRKGLILPTDAVVEDNGKKYVYIIEGDKAYRRDVVLAEGNTKLILVESGVKLGDKVVIKGQSQLKDQAKVNIVK